MNSVNGVGGSSSVNDINPNTLSKQDFISAVYLERGNMLDAEVRRLAGEVEQSNSLLGTINSLTSKANVAQYGPPDYQQTTWEVNNNNIVLDNGYSLSVVHNDEGNTFTLTDAEGNQLNYQNQTLIPIPKGTTVDALKAGIPIMQDLTMVLDDGTEITFKPATPGTAFDSTNLSGGLADIASVYITRGNQGVSITNLDGDKTPVISTPTVEGVTPASTDPTTETINIAAGQQLTHYQEYGGSDSYSSLTSTFKNGLDNSWLPPLSRISDEENTAIMNAVKSGLSIKLQLRDTDGDNDDYSKTYTYTPRNSDDIESFVKRIIQESIESFNNYVDEEEGEINIERILAEINLPAYSYEKNIPEGDKSTETYSSKTVDLSKDYSGSTSYGKITSTHAEVLKEELKDAVYGISSDEMAGLEAKLRKDGMNFDWNLYESDGNNDTYNRDWVVKMIPGESFDEYIDRAVQDTAEIFKVYIEDYEDEGEINIERIWNSITIPSFSYDKYTVQDEVDKPITYHSFDTNNNDGYVLLESGGVHAWEYDGQAVSTMTRTNPNDNTNTVSDYFARKLAFNTAKTAEYASGIPVITAAEKDIITRLLKITYSDASGTGNLTPEEWAALKTELEKAKNNLTGSNQLQTIQLQRALTTYSQNYEAMTNAESKIYNLLKDMISNLK